MRRPAAPPPPRQHSRVDPKVWHACAGLFNQLPTVNSRVYYFPQGHLEYATSLPTYLSPLVYARPYIPCTISSAELLADPTTDEVFAKLILQPVDSQLSALLNNPPVVDKGNGIAEDEEDKITSYAKVLTPSDANNGGGFSVPRSCADTIFPKLDYEADPPVQTLSVIDVHGTVWDFRHIYRGTPRRHLLTTGWSKFVNSKKLVAGDSVFFMKNLRDQMFVGVRRAVRSSVNSDYSRWIPQIGGTGGNTEDNCGGDGGIGREANAVAEAVELAAQNMTFQVVYYPKSGWSDFVVKAEMVEPALNIQWTAGMKVKMGMESEDSSRVTWFQGTVASAAIPDTGPWWGSPWRSLQVNWDEPEVLQKVKRVNPWEVVYMESTTPLPSPIHPTKKPRALPDSEFMSYAEGDIFFPLKGYSNSTMGQLNPSLLNYNTIPAGMQGARQNQLFTFPLTNPYSETNNPYMCGDNSFFCDMNMVPNVKQVSTELNMVSQHSDQLSPESNVSFPSSGESTGKNQLCNPTKVGSSIVLFGKLISKEPSTDNGCGEGDVNGMYNETRDCSNYTYIEML